MALQFDPSPYLQVFNARRQDDQLAQERQMQGNQSILQGLQMMADNRRQQQLLDIAKQKEGREQFEHNYKYGSPIDPNIDVGIPSGMGQAKLFGKMGDYTGNQPMNVGQGSPLIEEFNKFRAGGMKLAEARPEFMGALGQDERKVFYENANPDMEDEADTTLKLARADYLNKTGEARNPSYNQENKLRSEFLNQSKDFTDTAASYQRMVNSSQEPSAAGDLALIFNYMKMLDPGSTVREGEFANAAASGSYGSRFQAAAQKILSGQRLDDTMRQDFMGRATSLYQGQMERHKQRESEYQSLAKSYGGNPDRVTPNLSTPMGGYGQSQQTPESYLKGIGAKVTPANLQWAQTKIVGMR